MNVVLAGLGAVIGALLRYIITNYGKRHWKIIGKKFSNLPIPTLLINLTGSLILGAVFGIGSNIFIYSFLGTGVLGGYTTFSTLNTELIALFESKNYRGLLSYALCSYLGGICLIFVGYYLGQLFR